MDKKKIVLWGTGHVASETMTQYETFVNQKYDVLGWVDSNPIKQGKYFYGKMILPPFVLLKKKFDYLVILTDSYDEIKKFAMTAYSCPKGKIKNKFFFCQESLMERYKDNHEKEIIDVLDNIRKNGLQIFNYDYVEKYKKLNIEVFEDTSSEMFYVMHQDKKLYFKREFQTEKEVRNYYSSLLSEQDVQSPHRYISEDFCVEDGDVLIDAGAAEGIFSLENIDKIDKLYLIESDPSWMEALKKTFLPYKDKVIYIDKYLCDSDYGIFGSLDALIKVPVDFIKMDIEGNEWDALRGAQSLMARSPNVKCSICCYHTDYDEALIEDVLHKYGLQCLTTAGYMWFPYLTKNRFPSDRLHRGVIRAKRRDLDE